MEFLTRDIHESTSRQPIHHALWEGRPRLLPYLLINGRLDTCLLADAAVVLFMRGIDIAYILVFAFTALQLITGLLRWSGLRYVITHQKIYVCCGRKRYWLRLSELMPTEYHVIESPIERFFGCCTIVYGVKPMTAILKGPWRNKTIFWCIPYDETPQRLIESAHDRCMDG